MEKRRKIVLDTNVLLVSISSFSKYHWIYQLILERKIEVYFSNEIISEYFEIISKKYSYDTAKSVIRTLLELGNAHQIQVHYRFNLIANDPDDNKFVDCAIASNVDYIVTNDKDFNILKTIGFPKICVLNIDEFSNEINK